MAGEKDAQLDAKPYNIPTRIVSSESFLFERELILNFCAIVSLDGLWLSICDRSFFFFFFFHQLSQAG
jgi:hypothetical protein